VRQILPAAGPELEVVPVPAAGPLPESVRRLAGLYQDDLTAAAGGRWLRANMISSADGAAALAGRSGGLSGPADRMLFTVLRSLADVILVGAATARAERYRPVTPASIWGALRPGRAGVPPIAVVTSSLDLHGCERLLDSSPPVILITGASAPREQRAALAGRAEVVTAGADHVDVREAVTALAAAGYLQILAEGGPGLLGQLTASGLVDELCLTTSPLLAGGPAGRIVTSSDEQAPATPLRLAHVLADNGFLLSRYLRCADADQHPGRN
jgi:riboflavin biosynthesis pyrimidine reductase